MRFMYTKEMILVVIVIIRSIVTEQRFSETPVTYQEVSSGDDVQIRCKVQDKRGQCIWQKDRKPVGMYPDKYEWASSRDDDCTLLIRRASLDFDDGFWECQVTSGDFARQDALTSLPSRLLVRVTPKKPRLEYGGTVLNTALTLRDGQELTISCVSRYGNPPAVIKWYIGDKEVNGLREQTNATEVDRPKTWAVHSLLRIRGRKENHGLMIQCITIHPSSLVPVSSETRLDIHYIPEVKLEANPHLMEGAFEDSASFATLKCIADANPLGTIRWFKNSVPISTTSNIAMSILDRTSQNSTIIGSELRFQPVKKQDAGSYSCKAINVIGESIPANYRLDVQYGPELKLGIYMNNDTSREVEKTTVLGSTIEPFECAEFEANPPAEYRWVHLRGGITETIESKMYNKKAGKRLRLKNVMWSDEGEYKCVAFNVINGVRRETPSEVHYVLHVTGPPEIQAKPSSDKKGFYESIGWIGEPVHRLKSRFCSRPPPRIVAWQWGSSHIRAGENIYPKYEALPLEPIIENKMVTNCYWAKLEIKEIQKEDARIYTLLVESEKGRDSTNIKLIIRDSSEIRLIAAAIAVGLLFLLVLISIGTYSLLRRSVRQNQHDEEEGSIAADAFYSTTVSLDRQKPINSCQTKTFLRKIDHESGTAVAYDYNSKKRQPISPEALKVRRAPVVLQPPTIV